MPPGCPPSLGFAQCASFLPSYCSVLLMASLIHPQPRHSRDCASPVDEKTPRIVLLPILCVCDRLYHQKQKRQILGKKNNRGLCQTTVLLTSMRTYAKMCTCPHTHPRTPYTIPIHISRVFFLYIMQLSIENCNCMHTCPVGSAGSQISRLCPDQV